MDPRFHIPVFVLLLASALLPAQQPGNIEGTVALTETGEHLHAATVHILELDRTALAGDSGAFSFSDVPPGTYTLTAHAASTLTEERQTVTVEPGKTVSVAFELGLAVIQQEVTVTASGRQQSVFEAIQSVETRDSFELASEIAPAIGETLANKPGNGIAKRSFGPGTDRPIIRGFDGDRVMILQDGIRTGTVSSQSGDHGELINSGNLDRMEIVKGPATLLYGGSAVGGVVNTISRHHAIHEHAHQGVRGHISGSGGSANGFASGSAGFEYGHGKWLIWGAGSGQSSGEYSTPEGKVPNSDTRMYNGNGGFGRYGEKMFFSVEAQYDNGVYGIPFADELHAHGHEDEHEHEEPHAGEDHPAEGPGHEEEPGHEGEHEDELERVQLEARRQNYRFNWGLRNMEGAIQEFALRLNYSRWIHDEVEVFEDGDTAIGTTFDNQQYIYRGTFEQKPVGPLTGRFGFWGQFRDYKAVGEEALSPPVDQVAIAGFVLEELDFERVKLQFGARVEHNSFDPAPAPDGGHEGHGHEIGEGPEPVDRSLTGFSGAAGANFTLWEGGAFVANYTHSYRPPALEELYNFGPHVGNLAFEVGDPALDAERGNGVDFSLRHQAKRVSLEGNFYYYDFSGFIFPFDTGEVEDGLMVLKYAHSDARFLGTEISGDVRLNHAVTLNLGLDYVNAEEKSTQQSLPRIPPLRGRAGFDWHWKGLEVKPELLFVNRQTRTFSGETETAGYVLGNIRASYSITRGRLIHQFAVNTFNLGDILYRNHSSFIKHLAPEIGRGVRFTYRMRFF